MLETLSFKDLEGVWPFRAVNATLRLGNYRGYVLAPMVDLFIGPIAEGFKFFELFVGHR